MDSGGSGQRCPDGTGVCQDEGGNQGGACSPCPHGDAESQRNSWALMMDPEKKQNLSPSGCELFSPCVGSFQARNDEFPAVDQSQFITVDRDAWLELECEHPPNVRDGSIPLLCNLSPAISEC